jgi:ribonuclease P protein component
VPSFSLPKSSLLTKPWEYRRVYAQGQRARGDHFSLIYLVNEAGENRLGISVHGVKSAVRRNRLKRIVREFYRHHRSFIRWGRAGKIRHGTGVDVVFAIRKDFTPDSPREVEQAVRELLERRSPAAETPAGRSAGVRDGKERNIS